MPRGIPKNGRRCVPASPIGDVVVDDAMKDETLTNKLKASVDRLAKPVACHDAADGRVGDDDDTDDEYDLVVKPARGRQNPVAAMNVATLVVPASPAIDIPVIKEKAPRKPRGRPPACSAPKATVVAPSAAPPSSPATPTPVIPRPLVASLTSSSACAFSAIKL